MIMDAVEEAGDDITCAGCDQPDTYNADDLTPCADQPPGRTDAVMHCPEHLAECLYYGPCQADATLERRGRR